MQNSTLLKVSVPNEKGNGWVTVDVALPKSDETIRELTAGLVSYLRGEFIDNGRKTTYFDGQEIRWSLSKGAVGSPLSSDLPLKDSGLVDGDRVYLMHESAREEFTKVLDDTSDAVASQLKNTYPEWENDVAARHMSRLVPVSTVALCLGALWAILSVRDIAWFVAPVTAALFVLVSILGLVYALPSVATAKHWEQKYLAGMSSLVMSMITAGVAGFLAPPLPVSVWNVLAAGAAISAVGIAARSILITGAEPITHSGIAVGASLALAGGIGALTGFSTAQTFILVTLFGLITLLFGSMWALPLAHVASPYVPSVGESFIHESDKDLSSLPMSAEAKAVEEIVGQIDRIHASRGILLGLRVGAIISIGLGMWGSILTYNSASHIDLRLLVGFVVSSGFVILAASTSEIDEQIHTNMLWSTAIATLLLPAIAAIAGGDFTNYVFPAIGVIGVVLTVAVIYNLKGSVSVKSPKVKFTLEILEQALVFTPFALSVFIFDIYGIVVSL